MNSLIKFQKGGKMTYILRVGNNGSKKFNSLSSARNYAKRVQMRRIFIAKPTKAGFKIFR